MTFPSFPIFPRTCSSMLLSTDLSFMFITASPNPPNFGGFGISEICLPIPPITSDTGRPPLFFISSFAASALSLATDEPPAADFSAAVLIASLILSVLDRCISRNFALYRSSSLGCILAEVTLDFFIATADFLSSFVLFSISLSCLTASLSRQFSSPCSCASGQDNPPSFASFLISDITFGISDGGTLKFCKNLRVSTFLAASSPLLFFFFFAIIDYCFLLLILSFSSFRCLINKFIYTSLSHGKRFSTSSREYPWCCIRLKFT